VPALVLPLEPVRVLLPPGLEPALVPLVRPPGLEPVRALLPQRVLPLPVLPRAWHLPALPWQRRQASWTSQASASLERLRLRAAVRPLSLRRHHLEAEAEAGDPLPVPDPHSHSHHCSFSHTASRPNRPRWQEATQRSPQKLPRGPLAVRHALSSTPPLQMFVPYVMRSSVAAFSSVLTSGSNHSAIFKRSVTRFHPPSRPSARAPRSPSQSRPRTR